MRKLLCSLIASIFSCTAGQSLVHAEKLTLIQNSDSPLDHPWKKLATEAADKNIAQRINQEVPSFLRQMEEDREISSLNSLWGFSKNSDESQPNVPIVDPSFLALFAQKTGITVIDPTFKIGHAGLNHTYGYLFSNLKTPYGYKRARYEQGEIERGFHLPLGLFSGQSKEGSLLSSFTYFIGSIALEHPPFFSKRIAPALEQYNYKNLKRTRITETITEAQTTFKFYTDLIPFIESNHSRDSKSGNQALLIYSIDEGQGQKLITAFPIQKAFMDDLTNPAHLGQDLPIKLKYNAALLHSSQTSWIGSAQKSEF